MKQLSLDLDLYERMNVRGLPRFMLSREIMEINIREDAECGRMLTLLTHIHNNLNGTYLSVDEYMEIEEQKQRRESTLRGRLYAGIRERFSS